ncbi:hypothetical protein FHX69_2564 [Prauserella muralis]|nr:hypothetical protein FHX69_2564 [Prauserella muralis]
MSGKTWTPLSPSRFRVVWGETAWELRETPEDKYPWCLSGPQGTTQPLRARGAKHAQHRAEVWLALGDLVGARGGGSP